MVRVSKIKHAEIKDNTLNGRMLEKALPVSFFQYIHSSFNRSPVAVRLTSEDFVDYIAFAKYKQVFGDASAMLQTEPGSFHRGNAINAVFEIPEIPEAFLCIVTTENLMGDPRDNGFIVTDDANKIEGILNKIIDDGIDVHKDYLKNKIQSDVKTESPLFLSDETYTDVFDDFDVFVNSYEKYKELNLPWKRGYIFYGPPGNGKTKTIRVLSKKYSIPADSAKKFSRQTGELSLGEINEEYEGVFEYICPESIPLRIKEKVEECLTSPWMKIIYIEDIEKTVGLQTDKDLKTYSTTNILNVIDGVESLADGTIFIATSNDIKPMSKALINRPGRFDVIAEFKPPTHKQVSQMFDYYNVEFKHDITDYIDFLINHSMAYVEEFIKLCIVNSMSRKISRATSEKMIHKIKKHIRESKNNKSIGF